MCDCKELTTFRFIFNVGFEVRGRPFCWRHFFNYRRGQRLHIYVYVFYITFILFMLSSTQYNEYKKGILYINNNCYLKCQSECVCVCVCVRVCVWGGVLELRDVRGICDVCFATWRGNQMSQCTGLHVVQRIAVCLAVTHRLWDWHCIFLLMCGTLLKPKR